MENNKITDLVESLHFYNPTKLQFLSLFVQTN
jgi:hypothetical protein